MVRKQRRDIIRYVHFNECFLLIYYCCFLFCFKSFIEFELIVKYPFFLVFVPLGKMRQAGHEVLLMYNYMKYPIVTIWRLYGACVWQTNKLKHPSIISHASFSKYGVNIALFPIRQVRVLSFQPKLTGESASSKHRTPLT